MYSPVTEESDIHHFSTSKMVIHFMYSAEGWGNFFCGEVRIKFSGEKKKKKGIYATLIWEKTEKLRFAISYNNPHPKFIILIFFSLNKSDLHYTQSINNFNIRTYFIGPFYNGIHSSFKIWNICVLNDSSRNSKCWWLAAIFSLTCVLFFFFFLM